MSSSNIADENNFDLIYQTIPGTYNKYDRVTIHEDLNLTLPETIGVNNWPDEIRYKSFVKFPPRPRGDMILDYDQIQAQILEQQGIKVEQDTDDVLKQISNIKFPLLSRDWGGNILPSNIQETFSLLDILKDESAARKTARFIEALKIVQNDQALHMDRMIMNGIPTKTVLIQLINKMLAEKPAEIGIEIEEKKEFEEKESGDIMTYKTWMKNEQAKSLVKAKFINNPNANVFFNGWAQFDDIALDISQDATTILNELRTKSFLLVEQRRGRHPTQEGTMIVDLKQLSANNELRDILKDKLNKQDYDRTLSDWSYFPGIKIDLYESPAEILKSFDGQLEARGGKEEQKQEVFPIKEETTKGMTKIIKEEKEDIADPFGDVFRTSATEKKIHFFKPSDTISDAIIRSGLKPPQTGESIDIQWLNANLVSTNWLNALLDQKIINDIQNDGYQSFIVGDKVITENSVIEGLRDGSLRIKVFDEDDYVLEHTGKSPKPFTSPGKSKQHIKIQKHTQVQPIGKKKGISISQFIKKKYPPPRNNQYLDGSWLVTNNPPLLWRRELFSDYLMNKDENISIDSFKTKNRQLRNQHQLIKAIESFQMRIKVLGPRNYQLEVLQPISQQDIAMTFDPSAPKKKEAIKSEGVNLEEFNANTKLYDKIEHDMGDWDFDLFLESWHEDKEKRLIFKGKTPEELLLEVLRPEETEMVVEEKEAEDFLFFEDSISEHIKKRGYNPPKKNGFLDKTWINKYAPLRTWLRLLIVNYLLDESINLGYNTFLIDEHEIHPETLMKGLKNGNLQIQVLNENTYILKDKQSKTPKPTKKKKKASSAKKHGLFTRPV